MPKKFKWTPMRRLFVHEYLVDTNGRQAAIRAGYSPVSAKQSAWDLLQMPQIADEIKREIDDRARRLKIDAENVLRKQGDMAFFDVRQLFDDNGKLKPIQQLPETVAAAIASFEIVTVKIPGSGDGDDEVTYRETAKVKLVDRRAVLHDIARHLGMFNQAGVDKVDQFKDLTDEQLRRDVVEALKEEEEFNIPPPPGKGSIQDIH